MPAAASDVDALVAFVVAYVDAHADADNAAQMDAYMKLEARGDAVRFKGMHAPLRKALHKELKTQFKPTSAADRQRQVEALWALPFREARLLAIDVAMASKKHITLDQLPLYERMVREGSWWDLVDGVAIHLVGGLLRTHRQKMTEVVRGYIDDDHLWMRRTALLSQCRHKDATDDVLLFELCLRCAGETDFFMRKAIGWALREYSRTAPAAVWAFVDAHSDVLSPLSQREAQKRR